jgi:beta-lactamase family protein
MRGIQLHPDGLQFRSLRPWPILPRVRIFFLLVTTAFVLSGCSLQPAPPPSSLPTAVVPADVEASPLPHQSTALGTPVPTASPTAALLQTLLATVAPAPSPTAGLLSPTWPESTGASATETGTPHAALAEQPLESLSPGAADYAASRAEVVGVAVVVPDRGVVYAFNGDEPFPMASVAKVAILAAVLDRSQREDRELTGREKSLLEPMITVSDNDSATELWFGARRRRGNGSLPRQRRPGRNPTQSEGILGREPRFAKGRCTTIRSARMGSQPGQFAQRVCTRVALQRRTRSALGCDSRHSRRAPGRNRNRCQGRLVPGSVWMVGQYGRLAAAR